MNIQSKRMLLRDFEINDLEDLHEILGDCEVMKYTEPAYDIGKTEDFLKTFCIEKKGAFAAVLKENNKVIGYVLFNEKHEKEIREIGWIFAKDYWRKGYAYEICKCLINHAFSQMGIHKIFAEAIDREKSVSLMKKLGMKEEGILRLHTKDNENNWKDLHWYGILKSDWTEQNSEILYVFHV